MHAWLEKNYGINIFLYGNARSAEYEFLKSLNLPAGSNVIVQAFTCNAVINPILWLGLEPRYVDISGKTFSFDIEDLKKKIDASTKVIILQHTFGISGPIDDVLKIAKEKGILVLEDCAHALGSEYKGKKLGTFGDAAILSFGIEKVISTRVGGALIVNNNALDGEIATSYANVRKPGIWETFKWLFNPLIWRMLRKFGSMQMRLARLLRNLGLLNMGFYNGELVGKKPRQYPSKLNNALSKVVLSELEDLHENLKHRRTISGFYPANLYKETAYVRFPFVCKTIEEKCQLNEKLTNLGYRIGDWYDPLVYPAGTDLLAMKYVKGYCPTAESLSARIINLPTGKNISENDAHKIADTIKENGN